MNFGNPGAGRIRTQHGESVALWAKEAEMQCMVLESHYRFWSRELLDDRNNANSGLL